MRFIWPQYLWLLAIVPLLVAAYVVVLRRRKPSAVRYADLGLVKAAIGPAQRVRRHLPPALFLLALLAVLLAVARPTAVVTLPSDSRTVLLVMDVSLSMRATDVDPNRMVAAQAAAKQFVRDLPSDIRAGIITFAGTALLVAPPTKNRENLVEAIDRFEMQRHTAIGSGMILALATLFPDEGIDLEQVVFGNNWGSRETSRKGAERDKPLKAPAKKEVKPVPPGTFTSAAVILLTDGRRTIGPDPLDAARMAANHGVRVFTVGFGSSSGGNVDIDGMSIYMRFDEETLKGVAAITQAEYFHAGSGEELKKIYEGLNTRFALERKETEISALFAAIAALLAVTAAALSLAWFNRIV